VGVQALSADVQGRWIFGKIDDISTTRNGLFDSHNR
jgi:hypothetical protein